VQAGNPAGGRERDPEGYALIDEMASARSANSNLLVAEQQEIDVQDLVGS
jgi:hypothetical protein